MLTATFTRALSLHRGDAYQMPRRLRDVGVVARFRHPSHRGPDSHLVHRSPKLVAIDPAFRAYDSLRRLLGRLAQIAGDVAASSDVPETLGERVDGIVRDESIDAIFGHPKRTLAIIVAHALGPVDLSTLSSMTDTPDGAVYTVLDPLVRDGILVSYRYRSTLRPLE
jgi:hypothetical protein